MLGIIAVMPTYNIFKINAGKISSNRVLSTKGNKAYKINYMTNLKSTLGKAPSHKLTQDQLHIEGPSYDEYDMLIVSRNKLPLDIDEEAGKDMGAVVHKTLMIKDKFIEKARLLVGDKLTRKNAGLGSIFSTLVTEYNKELKRKNRLLSKMRNCFDLIHEDTQKLISNRKHGRISQFEYYQKRTNKGRQLFKRMYYEYDFDRSDLLIVFSKDDIRHMNTWIISSEDNFVQALNTWTEVYDKTSKKKIWNQ